MKIKYVSEIDRKRFAQYVANCIPNNRSGFEPFTPNEHDDSYWTVDSDNDWKVLFVDNTLEIRHRYHNTEREEALAQWVAVCTGGTLVTPEDN